MEDYIIRGTAAKGAVRAFAATTRNTVQEARTIHDTTPVASAALGRLITAAAILGTTLKAEQDLLTLQIKGDGPIGGILATANAHGQVKGYVYNPYVDIPSKYPGKLDVSGAVGKGTLTVIKDIGLKEPYAGQIELVSGEIAEDLTYYFAQSEQVPSSVGLGVLVDTDTSIRQAGGFLIQLMPGADGGLIDVLEQKLNTVPYVTDLLDMGKTPEDILDMLLGDQGLEITDKTPIAYHCNCTRDRVEQALISIGEKDLKEILEEDHGASLKCHFCNKEYQFSEDDLKQIISEIKS